MGQAGVDVGDRAGDLHRRGATAGRRHAGRRPGQRHCAVGRGQVHPHVGGPCVDVADRDARDLLGGVDGRLLGVGHPVDRCVVDGIHRQCDQRGGGVELHQ